MFTLLPQSFSTTNHLKEDELKALGPIGCYEKRLCRYAMDEWSAATGKAFDAGGDPRASVATTEGEGGSSQRRNRNGQRGETRERHRADFAMHGFWVGGHPPTATP